MYRPKNQEQAQTFMNLLKVHHEVGGNIVASKSGWPMLRYFTPAVRYTVVYYKDSRAYVVNVTRRHEGGKPVEVYRTPSHGCCATFIESLFA